MTPQRPSSSSTAHSPAAHRVSARRCFELEGLHGARRGDYRIIYRIDDRATITAIEHPADVYR